MLSVPSRLTLHGQASGGLCAAKGVLCHSTQLVHSDEYSQDDDDDDDDMMTSWATSCFIA